MSDQEISGSILVVGDSPQSRELLIPMLEEKGYHVRSLGDATLSLQDIAKSMPDLILLAASLPETDPFALCEHLKTDKQLKDIPLLFFLDEDATEERQRCLAAGAQDYITKPFLREELLARVQTHLKLSHSQELKSLDFRYRQSIHRCTKKEMEKCILKLAVEQSMDGIAVVDMDGIVLFANQAWADMHGLDQLEAVVGSHVSLFHTWGQMQNEVAPFNKQVLKSGYHEGPVNHLRKDGTTFPTQMKTSLFKSNEGENVGSLIGIAHDMSAFREVEGRLEQSERAYRSIFEHTGTAMAILEEDMTVSFSNSRIHELTGFSGAEIDGRMQWVEFVCPEDLETMKGRHSLRRALPDAVPGNYEFRLQHRDGTIRDIFLNITMIPGTQQSVVSLLDISDLKEMEQALRRNEQRLHTLVNSTPDIICFKDGEGRWLLANDSDLQLFQLEGVDYLGKTDAELAEFSSFYHDAFLTSMDTDEQTWKKGGQDRGVETIPLPDGSAKILDVIKVPLFNDDGSRHALVVYGRDITEHKEMEGGLCRAKQAAEVANQARGAFLANMSHEIRTPMNAIIGMNRLALESGEEKERTKYAQIVQESAEGLLGLLNDILDFSKIEANQLELDIHSFHLGRIMKSVVHSLEHQARKKGIDLSCIMTPELELNCHGASLRLRQILFNLVQNGIKFTSEGSVIVKVDSHGKQHADAADRIFHFTVTDTGPGIPRDQQEEIFTVFSQVDKSLSRRHGGSGLGLSIARQLVQLMGGKIWLESSPGHGTTFHFTLTFSGAEGATDQEGDDSPAPLQGEARKRTIQNILLVEDDKASRLLARTLLERKGYGVTTAKNGLKALEILSGQGFDLIFMDVQMPELDGLSTSRLIRHCERGTLEGSTDERDLPEGLVQRLKDTHTPIIALTAHAMSGDRQECLAAGMDAYLTKPILPERLQDILEKIAGGA